MSTKQLYNCSLEKFRGTLASCGFDDRSVEHLIHSVSWNKKLSLSEEEIRRIALPYFDKPTIFLSILFLSWDLKNKQIFPEFIRLLMYSIPEFSQRSTQITDNIQPVINRLTVTRAETINEALRTLPITIDSTTPIAKDFRQARDTVFKQIEKYKYAVASWPLHNDDGIYQEYRTWLKNALLIQTNSETEFKWIGLYKSLENRLASLTNFKMRGKGLTPLTLSIGPMEPVSATNPYEDTKNADQDEYEAALLELKDNYQDKLDSYETSKAAVDFIDQQLEEDLRLAINETDKTRLREEAKKKKGEQNLETNQTAMETAYGAFVAKIYDIPWKDWPENYYMPRSDNGILDRWYAWASQYWLRQLHADWFMDMSKMSRANDVSSVFRATQIVLFDDSSSGSSRFMRYALSSINMPQLVYVYVLRNVSPWWRAPEIQWEDIVTDAAIDVEKIPFEDDRLVTIHSRLNNMKESISEGLLSQTGNVILYTTSLDLIGYCLYNGVDIHIYNLFCGDRPIDISLFREQILKQSALLGAVVTPKTPESTRLLTFMVLMVLSSSSGLPMYVGFGWENVLKQWFNIVKEYQKIVRPDWKNPENTCAWLAREGDSGRVIINQKLLIPLVSRILMSKIAPEKPSTKLISSLPTWGKNYELLKEENRIGNGKVEPVAILRLWTPDVNTLFDSRPAVSEEAKNKIISDERAKLEKEAEERLKANQNTWNIHKQQHDDQQKQQWQTMKDNEERKIAQDKRQNDLERSAWRGQLEAAQLALTKTQEEIENYRKQLEAGKQQVETLSKKKEELEALLPDLKKRKKEYDEATSQYSVSWLTARATLTDPTEELSETTIQIEAITSSINTQVIENNLIKGFITQLELQQTQQVQVVATTNGQEPPELDEDAVLRDWVNRNPEPVEGSSTYRPFTVPYPQKEPVSMLASKTKLGKDTLDLLTLDAAQEMDEKDSGFASDSDDDDDDDDDEKWSDRLEWLYAQRQIFQEQYYAPANIEDLLLRFRIRFKDWTGAETVTINN